MIGAKALQQRLENMYVGIHESREDDFSRRVDDSSGVGQSRNFFSTNAKYLSVAHDDIRARKYIVRLVDCVYRRILDDSLLVFDHDSCDSVKKTAVFSKGKRPTSLSLLPGYIKPLKDFI
jgi:hypothetical protein